MEGDTSKSSAYVTPTASSVTSTQGPTSESLKFLIDLGWPKEHTPCIVDLVEQIGLREVIHLFRHIVTVSNEICTELPDNPVISGKTSAHALEGLKSKTNPRIKRPASPTSAPRLEQKKRRKRVKLCPCDFASPTAFPGIASAAKHVENMHTTSVKACTWSLDNAIHNLLFSPQWPFATALQSIQGQETGMPPTLSWKATDETRSLLEDIQRLGGRLVNRTGELVEFSYLDRKDQGNVAKLVQSAYKLAVKHLPYKASYAGTQDTPAPLPQNQVSITVSQAPSNFPLTPQKHMGLIHAPAAEGPYLEHLHQPRPYEYDSYRFSAILSNRTKMDAHEDAGYSSAQKADPATQQASNGNGNRVVVPFVENFDHIASDPHQFGTPLPSLRQSQITYEPNINQAHTQQHNGLLGNQSFQSDNQFDFPAGRDIGYTQRTEFQPAETFIHQSPHHSFVTSHSQQMMGQSAECPDARESVMLSSQSHPRHQDPIYSTLSSNQIGYNSALVELNAVTQFDINQATLNPIHQRPPLITNEAVPNYAEPQIWPPIPLW
ncbi:hypothetical protein P154DRAFT_559781 [Amniculicola lignicola CBS 123094]|uniref:Uncharacterized protein n=1 Tax=Amniculicola lignicola CBS 123094 TaxID=1392246 RepID=A0A6A5WXX7_9PLEO|nr:hypothetical protein P154DRAFT_559781 [Amniculicola lignicola CBS 123094]